MIFKEADAELNGAQKVAALLLSLLATDRQLITQVLDKFDPEELAEIADAASHLGAIPPGLATENISEFLQRWEEGPSVIGSPAQGQLFIQSASDRKPANEEEDAGPSIWERCADIPIATLQAKIAAENPQVAALWLSLLAPALASKVIAAMNVSVASKIVSCLSNLATPRPQAVEFLAEYVTRLFEESSEHVPVGDAVLLPVIASLQEAEQERLIEQVSSENPELAENLRKNLFKFSDIEALALPARIALFEKISTDEMILALNGADPDLADACLQALGARMRRMVEQELARQSDAAPEEIAKSRQRVVSVAMQLIRDGVIKRA